MKEYIIYGRENCPFCTKIQNFMKEKNASFVYVTFYNLESNLKLLMEKHQWRTVPIVIEIDRSTKEEKLIGGCDDTIEHIKRSNNNE